MTHQIIKQPDGRYAIFDTAAEEVVYYDLDSLDVQDAFQANSDDDGREVAARRLAKIDAGENPYGTKAVSWEQAIDAHLRSLPGDEMGLSLKEIVAR